MRGGVRASARPALDPITPRRAAAWPDASELDRVGQNYNPHVTIGVGPRELLDEMVDAPFDKFVFSPSGLSVYQLGNLGTAARKLHHWSVAPGR